jgi:hypothetical protein
LKKSEKRTKRTEKIENADQRSVNYAFWQLRSGGKCHPRRRDVVCRKG